jgi:thiopeptide-type bacteriocin biosynthesis protein
MEPGLAEPSWQQVNITFPAWADAERAAVAHVAPLLTAAESRGLITSWFFLRKAPCWRIRYLPDGDPARTITFSNRGLEELKARSSLTEVVTGVIYEPETCAFGGAVAMACAHRLFHQDSSHTLAYLAAGGPNLDWRRELSVILCAVMLRAARLDWYEKGDVRAQVASSTPMRSPDSRTEP